MPSGWDDDNDDEPKESPKVVTPSIHCNRQLTEEVVENRRRKKMQHIVPFAYQWDMNAK